MKNGTDGVLFLPVDNAAPIEIETGRPASAMFDYAINSMIYFSADRLSPNERKIMVTIWFLSIFFESIMPTKAIIAFIGEKGSGKTTTARKLGRLIFGADFNVTALSSDPKDFDAAVTNSDFVVIDNADSPCTWINDKLATLATGTNLKKRVLYTTNNMIEIPTKCFLAITAHTPNFTRDDVADRLLLMKLERREGFKGDDGQSETVVNHRKIIMTEVVHYIQEVTRALKASSGKFESSSFRMGDLADFAIKIGRYAGIENEIHEILRKLSQEQSSFALEHEPLAELIYLWAAENPDIEVSSNELCKRLEVFAEKRGLAFAYKGNGRGLAQKLTNLRSNLKEHLDISERYAGGRRRLVRYSLKKQCDA